MVNLPKLTEKPMILYEVIRVIDHVPLFLEDHLERLYHTAELNRILNLPDDSVIRNAIVNLISDENQEIGNIKLTFSILRPDRSAEMDLVFIPHSYPAEEKYVTGVKVGILKAERQNPQAKIQNMTLRNKANLLMSKENVFEVLLVDKDGNITEGSRSNIFLVKDNQLFTSLDEKVLQGITRKKIVKLCDEHKIPLVKNDIPLSEINRFEGAFLTGSSPKVLPIYAIADINFNPGLPLIKKMITLYDEEIREYIASVLVKNKN